MPNHRSLVLAAVLGLVAASPAAAQQGCEIVQITDTTGAFSLNPSLDGASPSLQGGRIAFDSSADLTGGNPDGNPEIFLAVCGPSPTSRRRTTLPRPIQYCSAGSRLIAS